MNNDVAGDELMNAEMLTGKKRETGKPQGQLGRGQSHVGNNNR
jgi:hypothetical protein